MEYGGFWIRAIALMVDSVICTTAVLLVMAVSPTLAAPVAFLGPILYYAAMQSSSRQATFGKSLLGMKISNTSGERISFLRSLGRELAKIISYVPLGLGFL